MNLARDNFPDLREARFAWNVTDSLTSAGHRLHAGRWLSTLLPLIDGKLTLTPLPENRVEGEEALVVKASMRFRPDVLLFSETPSRAVVTTRDELRIAELARRHGVPWSRIGVVGATGNARTVGCHLHFEIHSRGRPIDPEPALHAWDHWS